MCGQFIHLHNYNYCKKFQSIKAAQEYFARSREERNVSDQDTEQQEESDIEKDKKETEEEESDKEIDDKETESDDEQGITPSLFTFS